MRRPTLPQPGPEDIGVGDLLELAPWGRWALRIRNNYGKDSREWLTDGGIFLVIEDLHTEETGLKAWELFEPATNTWSNYSMNLDRTWRSAIIIRHVPADSDEVHAILKP